MYNPGEPPGDDSHQDGAEWEQPGESKPGQNPVDVPVKYGRVDVEAQPVGAELATETAAAIAEAATAAVAVASAEAAEAISTTETLGTGSRRCGVLC